MAEFLTPEFDSPNQEQAKSFIAKINEPLPEAKPLPPLPQAPNLSIEGVRADLERKEAERKELAELWNGPRSTTRQGIIEAMQRDGQVLTHGADLSSLMETMDRGYFLPTAIRNLREGRSENEKRFHHASRALHFALNCCYFGRTRHTGLDHVSRKFAMFVTHPGIMMARHDVGFGGTESVDNIRKYQTADIAVSGINDDPSDASHEIDVHNGIFVIEDIKIDPTTGEPSSNMTKEEYEARPKIYPEDTMTPERLAEYPFAVRVHEYFGQMMLNMPEEDKPHFQFVPETDKMDDMLTEFRQKNNIPEPDMDKFVHEVELFNPEVIDKTAARGDSFMNGGGSYFRLSIDRS